MIRYIAALGLGLLLMSFVKWQPNFEIARQEARQKHQLVLLNFSGSDWCGPCIRMRKGILENETFTAFSDSTLQLVNADFPRNKKNQLSKDVVKANEALADRYNKEGVFPYTVLLDADGNVLKSWSGLPQEDASGFIQEIKQVYDTHKP
ncbi:MAG: thioredoxin family protein [Taibaiella sp.]|jgi:thiol-disulfide isomerase/thioredoxin